MKASSAQRQLNIRSDEAHALAVELARRLNKTTTAVVIDALRNYANRKAELGEPLPETVVAANEARIEAAIDKLWGGKPIPPGLSSDHDWLYDENGLPK